MARKPKVRDLLAPLPPYLREGHKLTMREARLLVGQSLKVLEAFSKGLRGSVNPQVRKAYKMVLDASKCYEEEDESNPQ